MNTNNIILATDSYKLNHWNQYPRDTERVYSYFESRQGAMFPYTVFFGLQYILEQHLVGQVVTRRKLADADALARAHFGRDGLFNYEGWKYIAEEHNGHLPVRIKAVAEGSRIPTGHVLMTVENTDPKCFWLTNALETVLTQVWYPSTVATLSNNTIKMIEGFLEETGGDLAAALFILHDFGCRGATGMEAAALGGAGHLITSRGTDTLPAMRLAMDYYSADLNELAFSVPATEHSVMTSLGRAGEFQIVEQLLAEYPQGILSVVSDSYDVYGFVERVGTEFHEQIMERDGKFVFRPDSGDPVETMIKLSAMLEALFGVTKNDAGYKVFDPHVGLLWGDGIGPEGIAEILAACQVGGYAAENYVFGMGGGLLQKVNRDTQRFAFKCSAQMRGGEWHDVCKDPLDSSKISKKGRLVLEHNKGQFYTAPLYGEGKADGGKDLLKTVFENGVLMRDYTFAEVRANAVA